MKLTLLKLMSFEEEQNYIIVLFDTQEDDDGFILVAFGKLVALETLSIRGVQSCCGAISKLLLFVEGRIMVMFVLKLLKCHMLLMVEILVMILEYGKF
ncbi:hypothetical protein Pfo_010262 [Paulownia fortunei]|nr:hypothetical protein Pfo_010262 [Paulownia fortunei]